MYCPAWFALQCLSLALAKPTAVGWSHQDCDIPCCHPVLQRADSVKVQSVFLQSFSQDFRTFPSQSERGRELLSSVQTVGWWLCSGLSDLPQQDTEMPAGSHPSSPVPGGRGERMGRKNGEFQPPNSSKSFRCPTSLEEKSGAKGNPGVPCLRRLCPVFLGNTHCASLCLQKPHAAEGLP